MIQPETITGAVDETSQRTDWYSLFAELVALKNEILLESRQIKAALDEFRAVFEALQTSQIQLGPVRSKWVMRAGQHP